MEDFRITHIFDDDKFIDTAINLMESEYPGKSDYLVIKNHDASFFTHVKSPLAQAIRLQDEGDILTLLAGIKQHGSKAVFFHALNARKQKIAVRLPDDLVKVWFVWGFDLYTNWKRFQQLLFERETRAFITKDRFFFHLKQKMLFNDFTFSLFLKSQQKRLWLPRKMIRTIHRSYATTFYEAAKRMDVVVPVIPSEYDLIKTLKIKAVFAPFTYGTLEEMLGDKINGSVRGAKDILVGNSADPSNNHADVFRQLSIVGLQDKKVYVPLSYGGNPEYIDFVIAQGKRYLGDNFIPLTDFLSPKAYNELLSDCGFLIFNHLRQQGVGNIIMLGYRGAKVFLHEKSPVYAYYRKLGIHLYSTQKINSQALFECLTAQQHAENQRILQENYADAVVRNKVRTLLETVKKQINAK